MSQLCKATDQATTQEAGNSRVNSNAPRQDILSVPEPGDLLLPDFVPWLPLALKELLRFGRAEVEIRGSVVPGLEPGEWVCSVAGGSFVRFNYGALRSRISDIVLESGCSLRGRTAVQAEQS